MGKLRSAFVRSLRWLAEIIRPDEDPMALPDDMEALLDDTFTMQDGSGEREEMTFRDALARYKDDEQTSTFVKEVFLMHYMKKVHNREDVRTRDRPAQHLCEGPLKMYLLKGSTKGEADTMVVWAPSEEYALYMAPKVRGTFDCRPEDRKFESGEGWTGPDHGVIEILNPGEIYYETEGEGSVTPLEPMVVFG